MALWFGMSSRAFILILGMLLVFLVGTIQARSHVQLAFACQRSMIFAQRKLWITMQYVYCPSRTLGNEGADHARCTWDLRLYLHPKCCHMLDSS